MPPRGVGSSRSSRVGSRPGYRFRTRTQLAYAGSNSGVSANPVAPATARLWNHRSRAGDNVTCHPASRAGYARTVFGPDCASLSVGTTSARARRRPSHAIPLSSHHSFMAGTHFPVANAACSPYPGGSRGTAVPRYPAKMASTGKSPIKPDGPCTEVPRPAPASVANPMTAGAAAGFRPGSVKSVWRILPGSRNWSRTGAGRSRGRNCRGHVKANPGPGGQAVL